MLQSKLPWEFALCAATNRSLKLASLAVVHVCLSEGINQLLCSRVSPDLFREWSEVNTSMPGLYTRNDTEACIDPRCKGGEPYARPACLWLHMTC